MKKILSLILILAATSSFAQKAKLTNPDEIVAEAKAQLGTYFNGDDFAKYVKKTDAKAGQYTFKISMYSKGKIESVRLLENTSGDIPTQNNLLHLIRSLKINIKTPKNKRYNFEHTVAVN